MTELEAAIIEYDQTVGVGDAGTGPDGAACECDLCLACARLRLAIDAIQQ